MKYVFRCVAFHDLGKMSPARVANQYAPFPAFESIRYDPSDLDANFSALGSLVFWNAFLITKSPT